MFQYFNFNFNELNKKENSTRFIFIGALLLILGIFSLLYKNLGIKIVSWSLGVALLCLAYLNLKNINELKRYASKEEIAPIKRNQTILLIVIALLFLFPKGIQSFISSILGIYLVASQVLRIIKRKDNPYYKLGLWNVLEFIFGLILIGSPLFLSKFISSIISFLIIAMGLYLFSLGNRLRG